MPHMPRARRSSTPSTTHARTHSQTHTHTLRGGAQVARDCLGDVGEVKLPLVEDIPQRLVAHDDLAVVGVLNHGNGSVCGRALRSGITHSPRTDQCEGLCGMSGTRITQTSARYVNHQALLVRHRTHKDTKWQGKPPNWHAIVHMSCHSIVPYLKIVLLCVRPHALHGLPSRQEQLLPTATRQQPGQWGRCAQRALEMFGAALRCRHGAPLLGLARAGG